MVRRAILEEIKFNKILFSKGRLKKTQESETTFNFGLPPSICDPRQVIFLLPFCGFNNIRQTMKHILVPFNMFQAQTKSILEFFKVPLTIAIYQVLRYRIQYSWSLTQNYLQYLSCLKLQVNTKFVFGLPEDIQRVFQQQKNHLRSVTSDRRPPPSPPSTEKVTLSSAFFLTLP